jgi:anti-sigma factor RsiW
MNDARFKELLNLHLDHRLSADEAHELEQALKADPVRRR